MSTASSAPSATLQAAVQQLISVAQNESHDEELKNRVQLLEKQLKKRDETIRLLRDGLANMTIATPPLSAPSDSLVLRASRKYPVEAHAFYPLCGDEGWPEKLDFHAQLAFAIVRDMTGVRILGVEAIDKRNGKNVDYIASCMLTSKITDDDCDDTMTIHFSLHFQNVVKGSKTEKVVRYVPEENVHLSEETLEALGELRKPHQFPLEDLHKFYPNAREKLVKLEAQGDDQNSMAVDDERTRKDKEGSDSGLSDIEDE
ncbi:hypothetical protein VNI00_010190 [Paramarasmius palmivorus]|uniref:Uncharacterized protein n=1 Tax=Paramarasmius palmivorus TaxID=297713 RepID=A0AAW0CJU3_9AGAR